MHETLSKAQIAQIERIVEEKVKDLPTKADIEEMFRDVMRAYLLTAGRGTKAILVTGAVIVGSLITIGGGFKILLALFGFNIIHK